MMSWRLLYSLILLMILLTIATVSARNQENQPNSETVEPPLELMIDVGGKTYDAVIGKPFEIDSSGGKVKLVIRAKPDRLFNYGGVEFRYPNDFAFEADTEEEGLTIWTLDGNDAVIMLYRFEDEADPEETRKDMVESIAEQYGMLAVKRSNVSLRLGGMDLKGDRLDVTLGDVKFRQDVYAFQAGKRTLMLILQDSIEEDGGPSKEFIKTVDLLKKTFKLPQLP